MVVLSKGPHEDFGCRKLVKNCIFSLGANFGTPLLPKYDFNTVQNPSTECFLPIEKKCSPNKQL